TAMTFTGNTVTNSTEAVAGGYLTDDTTSLTFGAGNHFSIGVGTGVGITGDVTATGTDNVDGTFNWYGGAAPNAISGGELNDVLQGNGAVDTVHGFGGDDTVTWFAVNGGGSDGNDRIDGGTEANADVLNLLNAQDNGDGTTTASSTARTFTIS